MQKIIGDFDMETARTYADLIDECVSGAVNLRQKFNGEHVVLFPGIHVIKHPYHEDRERFPIKLKGLINEFKIGRGLETFGMNVPKMHFVGINDSEIPFLVMDRLNITDFEKLDVRQRKQAIEQYKDQMQVAMDNGYFPGDAGDVEYPSNCGFDKEQRRLFFYDLTDWKKN